MSKYKHPWTGVGLCLFAVLVWGAMFPIMGDALRTIDPFTFTAIRYSAVAMSLLVLLLWKEGVRSLRLEGHALKLGALGSAGFAGFGFLVFLGQQMAGPSGVVVAGVIMALMPMLAMLIGWAVLGRRPLRHSMMFVVLSFVGVLLVVTKGDFAAALALRKCVLAATVILAGAACWVVYTMGASSRREWSALRYTTLTTMLGVPTILGCNAILVSVGAIEMPGVSVVFHLLPHLLYMVVVAGVLGVLAWNAGNRILNPVNGVLFMNVVPITAGIIAAARGYPVSGAEVAGAVMTTAALVLHNVNQRRGGVWRVPKLDGYVIAPCGEVVAAPGQPVTKKLRARIDQLVERNMNLTGDGPVTSAILADARARMRQHP